MSYVFHPEAEAELDQAIDWYEAMEPGLGLDFAMEIRDAIGRAVSFPKAWPSIAPDVRRCLVKRFPYGVLYAEEPDRVFVLAIMHLHRRPDYWKNRK